MVVFSKLKDSRAVHLSLECPTQTGDAQLHIPLKHQRCYCEQGLGSTPLFQDVHFKGDEGSGEKECFRC